MNHNTNRPENTHTLSQIVAAVRAGHRLDHIIAAMSTDSNPYSVALILQALSPVMQVNPNDGTTRLIPLIATESNVAIATMLFREVLKANTIDKVAAGVPASE
jgi:hypothetical protein